MVALAELPNDVHLSILQLLGVQDILSARKVRPLLPPGILSYSQRVCGVDVSNPSKRQQAATSLADGSRSCLYRRPCIFLVIPDVTNVYGGTGSSCKRSKSFHLSVKASCATARRGEGRILLGNTLQEKKYPCPSLHPAVLSRTPRHIPRPWWPISHYPLFNRDAALGPWHFSFRRDFWRPEPHLPVYIQNGIECC